MGLVDVLVQVQTRDSLPIFSVWSHIEQDRQWTYNVTLRHILETIVAVEKLYYILCVCVCVGGLSYPACNAHAPYCQDVQRTSAVQYFFHIIS